VAAAVSGLLLAAAAEGTARTPVVSFTATGSAEQVYVTGLAPSQRVSLLRANGNVLYTQRADSLGGLLFRLVPPGGGYRVRVPDGARSAPITVHSDAAAPWDPSIYSQTIADDGYQYLTTRDGTKLALTVWPPTKIAGVTNKKGLPPLPVYKPPYPTLIEYSGYGYADPSGPEHGIAALANAMGFAVVDVSMRGTGCSGGAYDFFEPLQNLDGYDIVETIAHQPWVLDHKVGMMGISYGAISQLFTAQLDPPDLEAIAPLSTIDATLTTLYPGGMLNDAWGLPWARQREEEAQPAGQGLNKTQPYAETMYKDGDSVCRADQALHGEAANLLASIKANSHYRPNVADPVDPISFVNKIKVPVFLACQWEDEEVGGHCPALVQHFTGTRLKWFTFTNGAHIDSLAPYTYNHWLDFLQLFVAHQAPAAAPGLAETHAAAPLIFQAAFGTSDYQNDTFPSDPIQQLPSYSEAVQAFEQLPEVTVLFDNGAGKSPDGQSAPGDPYPGFIQGFSSLPVPGTIARHWYLAPGGTLSDTRSTTKAINWYRSNPKALPLNDWTDESTTSGGGLWGNASQWQWNWKQSPAGTAVSYISAPLTQNVTVIGAGAVHVWVRSSTADVDLLATVSEIDPDGDETFVQNGYLRASERKLATSANNLLKEPSTLLAPIPTELARDVRAMPRGKFVEVVIPLYYEGHVYRAGTRIRLTIAAPNGTQPVWGFEHPRPAHGTANVSIQFSRTMPSSLILPSVPGVDVPTAVPPCPSLRNEPCRPYVPFTNLVAGH
jgi:predicted acyl esterase